ncbi:MAG: cysteine hydrolase family protein [Ktedonobacteraceae bacterium]
MNNTALLIIDTQVGVIEPAYKGKEVLDNINVLLAQARASHTPIIYVQHDGPQGDSLEVGTPAWAIHPAIAPQAGELIVHKRASDSFYDTILKRELGAQGIQHLVVVGGSTEMCVDTTIRRATVEGYDVTLVSDAHTTQDYDEAVLTATQRIAQLNHVVDGFGTETHTITVTPTSEVTLS